jgi:hypothetical protein
LAREYARQLQTVGGSPQHLDAATGRIFLGVGATVAGA